MNELCEQTAVLYLGRIAESGPTAELLQVPAHPYTQALRSVVPEIDWTARRTRVERDPARGGLTRPRTARPSPRLTGATVLAVPHW